MEKFFDFGNPFYKPLWVKLLILAASGGWGLFELVAGNWFWAAVFLAAAAIAFHGFFIAKPKDAKRDGTDKP